MDWHNRNQERASLLPPYCPDQVSLLLGDQTHPSHPNPSAHKEYEKSTFKNKTVHLNNILKSLAIYCYQSAFPCLSLIDLWQIMLVRTRRCYWSKDSTHMQLRKIHQCITHGNLQELESGDFYKKRQNLSTFFLSKKINFTCDMP